MSLHVDKIYSGATRPSLLTRQNTESVSPEKHDVQSKSERILSTLAAEPHVMPPQPEQAKTRGTRWVSLLGASAIAGFAGYIYIAGANPFTRPDPEQTVSPTLSEPPVSDPTPPTAVAAVLAPVAGPEQTSPATAPTDAASVVTAANTAASTPEDSRDPSVPIDLAKSLEDGLKPQPTLLRTALEQTTPKHQATKATPSKAAPKAKILPARPPNKPAQAADGDVNLLAALISHSTPATKAASPEKASTRPTPTAREKKAEKKKKEAEARAKTQAQ